MTNEVVSEPYNMIAIICKRYSNDNNTYTIIPLEVSLGKIDEDGFFLSENGEYILPAIDDIDEIKNDSNEKFYIFADSYEAIKAAYKKRGYESVHVNDVNDIMIAYYREIASEMIIALVDGNEVYIYHTPYTNISKNIKGELNKHYEEVSTQVKEEKAPAIIKNDNYNNLKYIDTEGLEKYLKERIFFNDSTIEDIVTTLAMNYSASDAKDVVRMLSIGPTGSGKTETFRLIAEYLDIPFTLFDCSSLTASGYVGESVSDICRLVYLSSKQNRALAERSIVVLDEFDKLATRESSVAEEKPQEELLKFLEGYTYFFPLEKNAAISKTIELNTSFMNIACLGAFQEIFDNKKRVIGYNEVESKEIDLSNKTLSEYGINRQVLGRLQVRNKYHELTPNELKEILTHSLGSPILRRKNRYKNQFNVDLILPEDFYDGLVEQVFKEITGARCLDEIIERTFKKADRVLYRMYKDNNTEEKKLKLTRETIEDPNKFIL